MPIHVVIKRKFQMKKTERLMPLLKELSSRASQQSVYIPTEILKRIDNPADYMSISTVGPMTPMAISARRPE